MNPIEYELELRIRQAGRELADEIEQYLGELEDGIVANADDAVVEISEYLAIVAEGNGE